MSHPADFHDAHLRHWQDAEFLFRNDRWANADQLYGLSAECGLKAVMRLKRKHLPELWAEFNTTAHGHSGAKYLSLLPGDVPFANWSIGDRYAHRRHFDCVGVSPHRSAADGIRKMVQRARRDGLA